MKKILVVDDSRFNRENIRSTLQDTFEIIESCDGDEALKALELIHVDAIILDLEMPNKNGVDTLKAIRSNSYYDNITVIVVSAFCDINQEILCLETGADEVIRRPINNEVFKARIRNILFVREAKSNEIYRKQMESVLNSVDCGIVRIKTYLDGKQHAVYEYMNDEYCRMHNLSKELIGKTFAMEQFANSVINSKEHYDNIVEFIMSAENNFTFSYQMIYSGAPCFIDATACKVDYGNYWIIDIVERNVTKQRRLSAQIEQLKEMAIDRGGIFAKTIDLLPNSAAVFEINPKGSRLIAANKSLADFTGYSKEKLSSLEGDQLYLIFPKLEVGLFTDINAAMFSGESVTDMVQLKNADGKMCWAKARINIVETIGDSAIACAVFTDVDLLKQAADTDDLTGLYNRRAFKEIVSNIMKAAPSSNSAIIFIDVDYFKTINDTFGHVFGDKVICDIADIIKKSFRSNDYVARVGGDEFCIYANDMISKEVILERAEKVCQDLKLVYEQDGQKVNISCSIGIAYQLGNMLFDDLFKLADDAQYTSKNHGKGRVTIVN